MMLWYLLITVILVIVVYCVGKQSAEQEEISFWMNRERELYARNMKAAFKEVQRWRDAMRGRKTGGDI